MTVALTWELENGDGRPVLIRFDSKYAACITCATWRARKHKPLAAAARAVWRNLHTALKGKLWLKHVKGHSGHRWNDRADGLADEGRLGILRTGEITVD